MLCLGGRGDRETLLGTFGIWPKGIEWYRRFAIREESYSGKKHNITVSITDVDGEVFTDTVEVNF